VVGEQLEATPAGIGKMAKDRLISMVMSDFWDAIQDQGLLGAALAVPSILGVGIQTYAPTANQIKDKINNDIENQVWSQYPPQIRELSDQIIKLENSKVAGDGAKARQLLIQHPEILMARRLIAQQKAFLKRQLQMQEMR
ncbi:MAG: hypothetical protein V1850_05525, partial [Candidatus Bathyarchaeota archaeon]